MLRAFAAVLVILLGCQGAQASGPIVLGQSVTALVGPWRFHTGDDPHWKQPDFDDTGWETAGLTPAAGSHDADVGLTNYVGGWAARGHAGYKGFAWYRLSLRVAVPPGETLALAGPADVDSAYQIFLNGRLVGGDGDFSTAPPRAVSIQPHFFPLPRAFWSISGDQWSGVVAIRVWCRAAPAPDGGGIHIAPLLGLSKAIETQYLRQWVETFEGYIVDATEAIAFLLLAFMALSLIPFDRADGFYPWLAASLVLLAAARGNQAAYAWGQSETISTYVIFRYVLLEPLLLGAWTMTWRACFGLTDKRWIAIVSLALVLICMLAQLLSLSMFADTLPHVVRAISGNILSIGRVAFLAPLAYIAFRGATSGRRDSWLALLALVLVSIGLFATELSAIGVPGIWFPFGVGVSRTEYAYAAFDVVLFAYLLTRLWSSAPGTRHSAKAE